MKGIRQKRAPHSYEISRIGKFTEAKMWCEGCQGLEWETGSNYLLGVELPVEGDKHALELVRDGSRVTLQLY